MEKNGEKWLNLGNFDYFYEVKLAQIMTTFLGDIHCKIEAKGRLLFPSSFKKQLEIEQTKFVIKKDIYENCLVLYTAQEWSFQIEILRKKLNLYNREHSKFLREFYRDTAELSLDGNGRILIPKRLLELVSIKKEIYMLGLDTKIEIWAKDEYEKFDTNQDEFAELAQNILGNINLNE